LASHWQIQKHEAIQKEFPLLTEACRTIGGVQIQVRGTLGGNIANASPAGDSFPPLSVYEAVVHTLSPRGKRELPFLDVFTGVKETSLEPSELIESIEVPFLSPRPARRMFRKVGTRAASAISKTVAAGLLWMKRDGTIRELRFALGSMAPTIRRLQSVEAFVVGKKPTRAVLAKARELVAENVSPIDDLRSTAEYRLEVSRNLLCSFLNPEY
jgi:CO/xanthine dehydrogenase FAD-binding subunit